ncbi:MAG: glycosyltransferase family 2 protein [Treponema sp.]|uniref:glycosyltransferase family A protein n=1 Tax=Treponema sp. TaxID=166 RepID=UPI0025F68A80|nr:glycosyltransferase family 2 protein [Treponema sp.]MBQ8680486.1 glycosyltransferase family 2 protein [Treponema sp.]MBR1639713.1 glycosyltransferase family 2 protein [Treponema sp.]
MWKPLISVLIPVYGVEKYIEQCLESLFENTIAEKCEFIIVNDHTKDNSMQIVYRLKDKYSNIKIIIIEHEINSGLAATRNTGLSIASGKYFICTDSDDWVEKNYLEKLFLEAEETNADITACNWFEEKSETRIFNSNIDKNSEINFEKFMKCEIPAYVWNKLVLTKLVREHNLQWENGINNWEDEIISTKTFSFAKKFSCINIPLYHYRVRNDSYIRCLITEKTKDDFINAVAAMEEFLQKNKKEYVSYINFKKLHAKQKILLDGTRKMQKKYLKLWKESYPYIKQDKTLSTRVRIILTTAIKLPAISLFLLFMLSTLKIIVRKQFTWKEYFS